MKSDTLAQLIKFCEEKELAEVARGIRELQKPQEKDVLEILRTALIKEEKKTAKLELPKSASGKGREAPQKQRPQLEFNKEQNEEIMETLMNKIVAKPNFGKDPKTTAKIEKLMKVNAFQKMVQQADLLTDISNSSILNQSQFLQKSMLVAGHNSFVKMLPDHSQMKEDEDPD